MSTTKHDLVTRRSLIKLLPGATLFAACSLLPNTAFAQKKVVKEPTPEEKKGYTLPYFFTGLAVLAVATPLCWPALRKWDVSLKDDEE